MPKLKVLLIEDHLGERLNLIRVLNEYGAEVDTALTFSRARDLIVKRVYDLVISELLMSHCPELQGDGIQFWNFFQKIHPSVPLFLIADEMTRMNTEMLMHGSMKPPILNKPVNGESLKHVIEHEVEMIRKLAA
jgi:DNA-binding NtrC family response regulator